ncbi:MAG: AcrB/AcrD/AcrF family protein, partial [Epsilonproteobacteria bacterium]|nr:AcrB/AcrD/AcrF family protein [Campylobacterota bacterium]NPA88853.1 efflux RND transporter permease subunit [Campylobacterota bacterium]
MEKFIAFFIRNRYFTHTLFIILLILAWVAYKGLPKEFFPPATLDKIIIKGGYPGTSPRDLDRMVVSPLEDDLKNITEIESTETIIRSGSFIMTLNLKPGTDKLNTLIDVKGVISNLKKDLPADMNEPSASILKKAFPLMFVSIGSKTLSREQLLKVADDVKKELVKFGNLAQVDIRGDTDKVIYFYFDTQKLDGLGLGKKGLISVLQNLSTIYPIGKIEGKGLYFIAFHPHSVEEFKNSFIKIGGKVVRVGDIIKVVEKSQTPKEIGKFDGIPTVMLDIRKGEEGDAIALSHQIREFLAQYHKKHPEIVFGISTDTSRWVRNRFNTVVANIASGLVIVFFIMWLFLNWRLSLVVIIGIPTSFAIALLFLDYFNFSLNLLSLLGALIALGMIVDEAIVVGENIYRHLQMGKDPIRASIDGTKEVLFPVTASALTTIFAFLPMLMIKGEIGVFIKILPIMITILIISSLLEAVIFLPLHASEILKPTRNRAKEEFWKKFQALYRKILSFFLRHARLFFILFITIIPAITIWGFKHSKFQLFPDFDVSQIYITGKFDRNFTIERTAKGMEPIENALKPLLKTDVEGFTSVAGMVMNKKGESEVGENYFHIFVDLKELKPTDFYNRYIAPIFQPIKVPNQVRTHSAQEVKRLIEERLAKLQIPGLKQLNIIIPQAGIVKSDIVVGIGGKSDKEVLEAIRWLEKVIKKVIGAGVATLYDDGEWGGDEVRIKLNSYGKSLGLTDKYLYTQLRGAFGEGEIGKDFGGNSYLKLILQAEDKDNFQTLLNFRIELPDGKFIRLGEVAKLEITKRFKKIHKYDGVALKSVFLSLNKKIITTGEALEKLQPYLNQLKKKGFIVEIGGARKVNRQFLRDLMESGIVALSLIFLTLVLIFNSVRQPFIIVSVIFLSFLGVLIGNWLLGLNMTMLTRIGMVGLAGVVVNDGIVMVDFLKKARNVEELLEYASYRLRPILLTSITTFFGLFTLIFFPFGQSKILQPLAVALGFGLL